MDKNIFTDHYLDLRGIICPQNFVKCCLALESLSLDEVLRVDLDRGEPEVSVVEGLQEKGFKVKIIRKDSKMISLIISSEKK